MKLFRKTDKAIDELRATIKALNDSLDIESLHSHPAELLPHEHQLPSHEELELLGLHTHPVESVLQVTSAFPEHKSYNMTGFVMCPNCLTIYDNITDLHRATDKPIAFICTNCHADLRVTAEGISVK